MAVKTLNNKFVTNRIKNVHLRNLSNPMQQPIISVKIKNKQTQIP